jgi:tRNA threonylcarbamoyladenosine modification (KEOPS) complex Cgi121 subunit
VNAPAADVDVHVVGAQGSTTRENVVAAIREATENRKAHVQAFDPTAVYGATHLEAAARRAVRSHREDRAIARNLPVEIACYAAGVDQISDALDLVGLPETTSELVFCAIGEERETAVDAILDALKLECDDALVDGDEATLDRLGVPETARATVEDDEVELLVVEHVALLDAKR